MTASLADTTADIALIDSAVLDQLAEDCGAEMIAVLADGFAEEVTSHLDAIASARAAGDGPAASAALHGLRGGALALGLDRLAACIRPLETAAAEGRLPERDEVAELERLCARSLAAVRDLGRE